MNKIVAARRSTSVRAYAGLASGPLLFAAMLLLGPPEGMSIVAWRTAAVGLLMAVWWITEAIPIPATALLPIVLFPPLGVATVAATTAPYANPVIYLFLGGFLIAMALESCGLHRRMAIAVLGVVGTRPANLILGFMAVTAFISMWVSNSATVVMMLPMATSIIALQRSKGDAAGGGHARTFDVARTRETSEASARSSAHPRTRSLQVSCPRHMACRSASLSGCSSACRS